MVEQVIKGDGYRFRVVIRTADEMGGFPITGKQDAAIIEVYESFKDRDDDYMVDEAWLTISKNGVARLERVK